MTAAPVVPAHHQHALEHAELFTIACAWSGITGVYRPDSTDTHRYETSVRTPLSTRLQTPPEHPWAIHTSNEHTHRTILAADFDASKGGDPIADAAAFSALLTGLRCPHLISKSSVDITGGDTGNRHVLALLEKPWTPAVNRGVVAWLKSQYRTFDSTPMAVSRTAAIRFPGAPHRNGGHAELAELHTPAGTDPSGVLTGAVRAPADLADQILKLAAAAACGTSTPAPAPAPTKTVTSPTRLTLLVRHAAALIAGRTGRLHTSSVTTLPAEHDAADIDGRTTGSSSETPRRQQHRAPDDRLAVSMWAPRRDADTSLPTLSQFHRQWSQQAPDAPHKPRHVDDSNNYLRLPPHIRHLLDQSGDLPAGHASGPQHAVLMSLAAHGFTADDVAALALRTNALAFTHSRRSITFGTPIPRDQRAFIAHLRHQYTRAAAQVTRQANARTADEHRARIDTLTTVAVTTINAADHDPRLQFNRTGHAIRRTLEAHVLTALAAADTTYHCGARDLARIAGLRSPQTAATHTQTLIRWGFLRISDPSTGRRATQYQLQRNATWTQGEPAPLRPASRTQIGELIASRCGHFQHDVWLSRSVNSDAALVLLHLGHLETPAYDLPTATGLSGTTVATILAQLQALGLINDNAHVQVSQEDYDIAATRAHAAGAWSRVFRRWEIERARWSWWCAEHDFLTAAKSTKKTAYSTSDLDVRGRYPRADDHTPDHRKAAMLVAATLPALVEVTR